MIGSKLLTYTERDGLAKGLLAGGAMIFLYLLVVVVTTPSLPASASIQAAFLANPVVIAGTSVAVASQVLIASYGKNLGCSIGKGRVGAGSGSVLGAFFSFFSLVPLGCCGSWLFILSFLPSVLGGTASAFLIDYSKPLSYAAVASVLGLAMYSGARVYNRISKMVPRPTFPGRSLAIIVGVLAAAVAMPSMAANIQSADNAADKTYEGIAPVPENLIVSGGPPRDGIPSIDRPKFSSVQETVLEDSELVIGLQIDRDIRAYPLRILVWHEIINDNVGGVPVAVTYCPLCFTSQVFKRTIDRDAVEFGTSGKLYQSNLVMYDRTSESLWSQALGQAIAGRDTGQKLERIPFDMFHWKDWKRLYPESRVLNEDTGYNRPYGSDPYGDYYTSSEIWFPVSHRDDRFGPKEIVIGVQESGSYKAYPLQDIEDRRVIRDVVGGREIVLTSFYPSNTRIFNSELDGGPILEFQYRDGRMEDKQTSSVWDFDGRAIEGPLKGQQLTRLAFDEGFWFEWAAFHPETDLYR